MAATTVTVACKLPGGLLLEMDGKEPVILNGSTIPRDDNGMPLSNRPLPGGFGLTHGVDKEFWEAWKAKHAGFSPLEKGFVFAMDKEADAAALAKEMKAEKTGLEPIDTKNLPKGLEPLDAKE